MNNGTLKNRVCLNFFPQKLYRYRVKRLGYCFNFSVANLNPQIIISINF